MTTHEMVARSIASDPGAIPILLAAGCWGVDIRRELGVDQAVRQVVD